MGIGIGIGIDIDIYIDNLDHSFKIDRYSPHIYF